MNLAILLSFTSITSSVSIRKIRKVLDDCYFQLADGHPFEFVE